MDKQKFLDVLKVAAEQRGCEVFNVDFNDDDNVFDVTLDKGEGVTLDDCEFVHRAVLAAFDRDVEDYALTVGSKGMDAGQADELLSKLD